MNEYLELIAGFILLVYSGKYLVKGGVALASHLKVSTLVIGVTVVSFGTSAPELFVSVQAALNGHPEISIGNIIGSNISNIALVLAVTTLIFPIPVKKNSIIFDWPVMMLASLLFYFFILNRIFEFYEGLIFFSLLIGFVVWTIRRERNKNKESAATNIKTKIPLPVSIIMIIISCLGLAFGSRWLVEGASQVARNFHISETVISVSLIAVGTSLPELVTSAVAAFHKETDISIGNIIGSNIFNLFGVLGITGIIKIIPISQDVIHFHVYWMIGIAVLLLLMMLPLARSKLSRWEGLFLLITYILYIYMIFK